MKRAVIAMVTIMILSGCVPGRIITEVEDQEGYLLEDNILSNNDIAVYFERSAYSENELDEMFYVIENNSSEAIIASDTFFVQRYDEEGWQFVDNHAFNRTDSAVEIDPGESAEFLFWLSVNSINFEEGTYRLFSRIQYPEQTEELRAEYPAHEGVFDDLYLLFEIK